MVRILQCWQDLPAGPLPEAPVEAGSTTGVGKVAESMPAPMGRAVDGPSADASKVDFADWHALAGAVEERLRSIAFRQPPAASGSHPHDVDTARMQAIVLECAEALGQLREMASRMQR